MRVARSRGAVDLALGETLLRLFQGDRLLRLGFAKRADYAREQLGVPARTMFGWVQLARGLSERSMLRRAVVLGAVTPRKALAILPVAHGEQEEAWTAAAMTSTLAALQTRVRAEGQEPEGVFEVESLWLRMTPPQQDRLDTAIALVREDLGFGAARWRCVEAICQEWLGAFGAWLPDEERSAPAGLEAAPRVGSYLRTIEEAASVVEEEGVAEDPRALHTRALRLVAARQGFDATFGPLVARMASGRAWEVLGYRSLAEYCRERLGVSARSARERVWLERRMCALPELRTALVSGRLTYSRALLVARDATPFDIVERIAEAASTTWQQTERASTEREDRRNRAAGVRRLWGPKDATRTMVDAIASAQAWSAGRGSVIDAGEALAVVADHFVAVWEHHRKRPPLELRRKKILMRHGGLCAVPGCSRDAGHIHHIKFRSQGGTDEETNCVGLCAAHHLHGIHRGYLTVAGRAGERLVWDLGTREAVPLEVWITEGNDEVRRAG